MHPLLAKQNQPDRLGLLKAASVAYTHAKYFEVVFLRIMFFLAVAVPVVYLYFKTPMSKFILGLSAFTVTILIQLIAFFIKSNVNRGALFKEKFDVELFGLRWKTTIPHPDLMEIEKYALAYSGRSISNWYPDSLIETLPDRVCVAACQRINLEWDIWIRSSFCRFLYIVMGIHSALTIAGIVYFNPDGLSILPILFSSISFYLYFINQLRGHHSIMEVRKRASALIDKYLLESHQVPDELVLRDVQDEIFNTRKQNTLVPNFYFRFYHKTMQKAVDAFVSAVNTEWS